MRKLNSIFGLFALSVLGLCVNAEENTTCGVACSDGQLPDPLSCKCIPIKKCPQIKCQALSPPCLSYKRDKFGCRTCQCLYRCPPRPCPKCKDGAESFVDQFGCKSCRCKQPSHCKPLTCRLYCREGYVKDREGCDICQCKLCGDLCKIGCPYGKLVDFDGCVLCECKPKPDCGPVCKNFCPYGRVLDENGCPTCQCLPPPTCGPICDNFCPYGRVVDDKKCPTCECLPEPK